MYSLCGPNHTGLSRSGSWAGRSTAKICLVAADVPLVHGEVQVQIVNLLCVRFMQCVYRLEAAGGQRSLNAACCTPACLPWRGLQGDASTCPATHSPSPALPPSLGRSSCHPDTILAPPDGRVGPWAEDGLHDPSMESSQPCLPCQCLLLSFRGCNSKACISAVPVT